MRKFRSGQDEASTRWRYQKAIVVSVFFFFSSRRRHTRCGRDWSSDVCSSDLLFDPTDFEKDNGQKKESQTNAGFTKKNIVKVILLYEDGSFEDFDQKIKKQTEIGRASCRERE